MSTTTDPQAGDLADSILRGVGYDFRALHNRPNLLLDVPDRHGVSLFVAPTHALPDDALDAILRWRLAQYVLTGFYDADVVAASGMTSEDASDVHGEDVHGIVCDSEGRLSTYLTLKRPASYAELLPYSFRDRDRPLYPCEVVHGRGWQQAITGVDSVEAVTTWELARFVDDQTRPTDPVCLRGPLELGLAASRLMLHPRVGKAVSLICGDLDPRVALRNLRFFFMPVATFAPHRVELPAGHPLRPRYLQHLTAPFLATTQDVSAAQYLRWADIDLALAQDDEHALVRLLALRQFISVKESRLKRPLPPREETAYPIDSLTSASSLEAAAVLWRAAERGSIPWRAEVLGPGEALPAGRVCWVLDGFAQALLRDERGLSHLAAMGPEVALVPDSSSGLIAQLEAVTPMRVVTTERAHAEEYWRLRQACFETSDDMLYG